MQNTINRLEKLEQSAGNNPIPTYEEWQRAWNSYSELDKALYILQAENIDLLENEHGRYKRFILSIREYLDKMGLIDKNKPTLLQKAAEWKKNNV